MSATSSVAGRPCPFHAGERLVRCSARHVDGHVYDHCTGVALHNVDLGPSEQAMTPPVPRPALFPVALDRLGHLSGLGVRIAQALRESA